MSRYTRFLVRLRMLGAGAICLCLAVSAQAITYDAIWLFGDDPLENGSPGGMPGAFAVLDSEETGNPMFRDLNGLGSVSYVDVSSRPGASAGDVGLQFNGTSSRLYLADLDGGGVGIPENDGGYVNVDERFIQGWVRPNSAKMGVRQEIVRDTAQFGIHITADDTWGYNHDLSGDVGPRAFNSDVDVDFDEWTHVMLYTAQNQVGFLYINGVMVRTDNNAYGNPGAGAGYGDLSFGATVPYDTETLGNYFMGILDDFNVAVGDPEPTASINLFAENDFIAMTLDGFDPADVDLSGDVGQSDIDLLAMNWYEDYGTADLESRLAGDISRDGEIDFDDAIMLRNALIGAGAGAGLDFSGLDAAINGQVPEPTGLALALFALCGGTMLGRRRR